MKRLAIISIGVFAIGALSYFAGVKLVATSDDAAWGEICGGWKSPNSIERDSSERPFPNYDNENVWAAAEKLSAFYDGSSGHPRQDDGAKSSFAIYGDFKSAYWPNGLSDDLPDGVTNEAHRFLTILCGEFRDNLEMLVAKLNWMANTNIATNERQSFDPSKRFFEQLTGKGYKDLVELSGILYKFREKNMDHGSGMRKKSVSAMTVCEYKFMLYWYLSDEHVDENGDKEEADRYWVEDENDFIAYEGDLYSDDWLGTTADLNKKSTFCSVDEKNHYYEFRGDGNLKPQSLESNGLIWNSRIFSKGCEYNETNHQFVSASDYIRDQDCRKYFASPFKERVRMTEAGMLRLFFYPESYDAVMKDYDKSFVLMLEDIDGDRVADMAVFDKATLKKCRRRSGYSRLLSDRIENLSKAGAKKLAADIEEELAKDDLEGACRAVMLRRQQLAYRQAKSWGSINEPRRELLTLVGHAAYDLGVLPDDNAIYDTMLWDDDFAWSIEGIDVVKSLDPKFKRKLGSYLRRNDRGFPEVHSTAESAWDRIATVLDRHTDWYQIDMANLGFGYFQSTYSPWVASSYYIDKSHAFTKPGFAMFQAGDGHMHWMYVQKVHRDNWFYAEKLFDMENSWKRGFKLLSFWFDETTFSRSWLGAEERGWDKFGYVAPKEIEDVVYLYDVPEF